MKLFPPLHSDVIFITKEYNMELNRFKELLESTMGNVKPLITEQTVSTIPPLSNLPQEIQSDTDTMFNGTVVNDVIQLSGKTPGQIFSIKPTLKIGNLISIYCFMDTSVYPPKLKITDAKEGTKCFVCRSNGKDKNDTSNFVVYTNQSGVDTISQFTQETFNLRNVVTTGNNEQAILYQTYVKFKEYEPFKSDPKTISFDTTKNQVNMIFKDPSGKERNIIIASRGAENVGGERLFYLGAFECNETSCPLIEKISVSNKYPLSTVESFKSYGLIP